MQSFSSAVPRTRAGCPGVPRSIRKLSFLPDTRHADDVFACQDAGEQCITVCVALCLTECTAGRVRACAHTAIVDHIQPHGSESVFAPLLHVDLA